MTFHFIRHLRCSDFEITLIPYILLCPLLCLRLLLPIHGPSPDQNQLLFKDGSIEAEAGGIQTIRIVYNLPIDGELSIHYGSCEVTTAEHCHHTLGRTHVCDHPLAKPHYDHQFQRPERFVWLPDAIKVPS